MQRLTPSLHRHRSPREILHETVDDKTLRHAVLADRARDERISVEAGARSLCVIVCPLARHGDVDERIGSRIGREKREAVEEAAAVGRKAGNRGRPCRGEAHVVVVAHQILVEPVEHALAPLAPQREIMCEADALDRNTGASLLEPERETGEFVSERPGLSRIVRRDGAIVARALH